MRQRGWSSRPIDLHGRLGKVCSALFLGLKSLLAGRQWPGLEHERWLGSKVGEWRGRCMLSWRCYQASSLAYIGNREVVASCFLVWSFVAMTNVSFSDGGEFVGSEFCLEERFGSAVES